MGIEYGTIEYKVMTVLVLAGQYPYKSLDLVTDNNNKRRESIRRLKELGYIDVKTVGEKKRIRLKMFARRKELYAKDLFEGADNCEPDIRCGGERKLERIDRIAEVVMMMMGAGVNVTPDTKPLPPATLQVGEDSEYLPYFITSIEARAALPIKEEKGKGARFHGSLISLGGLYNVYNMGEVMMEWVRPSEKTAVDFNSQYQLKVVPWGKDYSDWFGGSAIVLSRNLNYIVDFVKGNLKVRNGYGSIKNLVNINEYYSNTYYLPLSRKGQIMMNIMTKRKWHYYLVGMFYKDEYLASPDVKLSIACDAVKNGCYCLVFMDGDIGRLKRFTSVEIRKEDYGKFKVICYDFQEEVVRQLVPPGMDVVPYSFDDVIKGFYTVYSELELSQE